MVKPPVLWSTNCMTIKSEAGVLPNLTWLQLAELQKLDGRFYSHLHFVRYRANWFCVVTWVFAIANKLHHSYKRNSQAWDASENKNDCADPVWVVDLGQNWKLHLWKENDRRWNRWLKEHGSGFHMIWHVLCCVHKGLCIIKEALSTGLSSPCTHLLPNAL